MGPVAACAIADAAKCSIANEVRVHYQGSCASAGFLFFCSSTSSNTFAIMLRTIIAPIGAIKPVSADDFANGSFAITRAPARCVNAALWYGSL